MKHVDSLIKKLGIMLLVCLAFGWQNADAQRVTSISGKITDAQTGEALVGANIAVKGTVTGTISDTEGNFALTANQEPPLTLIFSIVGYRSQELVITTNAVTGLNIKMAEGFILGQEVVVSASRVEESILQSPVSIEVMDIIAIREAAAPSFYDALANLKGVEMSTQSLTFKSFNTRGFNANGNVRTVQMIDGMDNQAPGLNFSVGNIAGISELDLESVELLPGAASALYGPNAINGILLMNSKNPFQYQGLSANVKTGIMNEQGRQAEDGSSLGSTGFYDVSIRYAKAFNDKVAFKVNLSHMQANDWQANDQRDMSLNNGFGLETGTRQNNPGFNGVNVYGDENATLIGSTFVSRTGYLERDLADYDVFSTKINAALHWRINNKVEAIFQGNYGSGTTVYTGADRYSITGFNIGQYKAELRSDNWYVRAYTTQERSGDAFAVGIAASGLNEAYNPSRNWFTEYGATFQSSLQGGSSQADAHSAARTFADRNRLQPGTPQFQQALNGIITRPIPGNLAASQIGAQFQDATNLYHGEFMYDFSKDIKFAEFVVGGNYRQYDLNSEGTLFALDDDQNEFTINEFGGYLQGSKRLLNDKVKVSASVRYDKNENFAGQWSPRASGVWTFKENNNFRVSWQTGFRIPTTQDQYIDLQTPQARLVGGLPLFRERYDMVNNPVYSLQTVQQFGAAVQAGVAAALGPNGTGNPSNPLFAAALQRSTQLATQAVIAQVQAGQIPNNPAAIQAAVASAVPGILRNVLPAVVAGANQGILQPYEFQPWEPERVRVFEVGYKGLIGQKLLIDAYYYSNTFEVFSGSQVVVQDNDFNPQDPASALRLDLLFPNTRNVYSLPVSDRSQIRSNGWALGADYALPKGYRLGGNVSYNALVQDEASETITGFNTPDYRFNLSFANREVAKNVGFNVVYRWQNDFVWNSSVVSPALNAANLAVVDAFGTLDAQVSYRAKDIKTIFKLGGSNILNTSYQQAFVNPFVGSMWYVSITFDEFLN